MQAQDNWPDGHAKKAENLVKYLETHEAFSVSKIAWSTGVVICSRKK